MKEVILPPNLTTSRLKRLSYVLEDRAIGQEGRLKLIIENEEGEFLLEFRNPSQVQIDKGFSGSMLGMEIADISYKQWAGIKIAVQNYEGDPGIEFYAAEYEIEKC